MNAKIEMRQYVISIKPRTFDTVVFYSIISCPVGIWCQNDVVSTSMRRDLVPKWRRIHVDATWFGAKMTSYPRRCDVIWCQNDVVFTSMRRDLMPKWRHTHVDATWLRRIDVDTASFCHQMPTGWELSYCTTKTITMKSLFLIKAVGCNPKSIFGWVYRCFSGFHFFFQQSFGYSDRLWYRWDDNDTRKTIQRLQKKHNLRRTETQDL